LHEEYAQAHNLREASGDWYDHWLDLEDEVMELITDLLPAGWYCGLVEDDPGTVAIQEMEEDIPEIDYIGPDSNDQMSGEKWE
jgi:hypothetical protein